jgi:hypothetical protein
MSRGPWRKATHNRRRNRNRSCARALASRLQAEALMNGIIYIIGLIVVILFILSFLGLW